MDIFGGCVNMYAGCLYLYEDVMIKDHHNGNFDLSVHFLFLSKYLDGIMQDWHREGLWMTSTKTILKYVRSYQKIWHKESIMTSIKAQWKIDGSLYDEMWT